MAKDLNKVMVTGRLGKDVEMRYLPSSGSAVATFSVASNRSVKQQDGTYQDQTEWFRVVVWEKLAETCANYLKKGSRVYIEGRLQTRKYQDKNKEEQTIVEVIASEMIMLDTNSSKGEGEEGSERPSKLVGAGTRNGSKARNLASLEVEEEDLPF